MSSQVSDKIKLYSLATPNGQKASIALEEMKIEYEPIKIDISKGDQFSDSFVRINPNSKIPAIVDPNGPDGESFNVFESGAVLLYLAEKTGKLLPKDPRKKYEVIQWMFFQTGSVGPMFGQFNHFYKYAKDKIPYAIERYKKETKRLLKVLDKQLDGKEYLVDEYSIADIMNFTWVRSFRSYEREAGLDFDEYPNVNAWVDRISERPAVKKGLKVCPF